MKAIGYLIPLMDAEYANYYTREVMLILIREFQSPDEEMKKIVLKVCENLSKTFRRATTLSTYQQKKKRKKTFFSWYLIPSHSGTLP